MRQGRVIYDHFLLSVVCATALLFTPPGYAGPFGLDFRPDLTEEEFNALDPACGFGCYRSFTLTKARCNSPWGSDWNCGTNRAGAINDELTPFYNEKVIGPDGFTYFHTIIGDPTLADTDFLQETYIRTGSAPSSNSQAATASNGDQFNAQSNPMGDSSQSGSGTAAITKTIVRQAIGDLDSNGDCIAGASVCQQFIKSELDGKPRIEQSYDLPDMYALFSMDMTTKSYDDGTAIDSTSVTNVLELKGPNAPEESANFDMANDAQITDLTGGAYTWTPGAGDGASGTWQYNGGSGLDPSTGINWSNFYDSCQNDLWTFQGNAAMGTRSDC